MKPRNKGWNAGHPEREDARSELAEYVKRTRAAAGLPPKIEDPETIRRLAAIFARADRNKP